MFFDDPTSVSDFFLQFHGRDKIIIEFVIEDFITIVSAIAFEIKRKAFFNFFYSEPTAFRLKPQAKQSSWSPSCPM